MLVSIVARMSLTLRERDRRLAAARERMLRDERVVALGSLAAGAAHALGTPLNTLTLLAEEIAAAAPGDDTIAEDTQELRRQIERCRQIVNGLLQETGAGRADVPQSRLDEWLSQLVHQFRQLRPESAPVLEVDPLIAHKAVNADPALTQAITHLLDNAVDSSTQYISMTARSAGAQICITVRDKGNGFSSDSLSHAGHEPYSDKPHGMGLGLYLASATAERLGGHLECSNIDGGAEVRLILPVSTLFNTSR
jgi:two-component system sensor histidine kinase RegB